MSVVGPRPHAVAHHERYAGLIDGYLARHRVRPGITGWAQVNGRDELPIPQKVALDAEYLRRQSLGFDLQILWMTFVKVLRRDGVAH